MSDDRKSPGAQLLDMAGAQTEVLGTMVGLVEGAKKAREARTRYDVLTEWDETFGPSFTIQVGSHVTLQWMEPLSGKAVGEPVTGRLRRAEGVVVKLLRHHQGGLRLCLEGEAWSHPISAVTSVTS